MTEENKYGCNPIFQLDNEEVFTFPVALTYENNTERLALFDKISEVTLDIARCTQTSVFEVDRMMLSLIYDGPTMDQLAKTLSSLTAQQNKLHEERIVEQFSNLGSAPSLTYLEIQEAMKKLPEEPIYEKRL